MIQLLELAEHSLFEKMLENADADFMNEAAKLLGVWHDEKINLGSDDETGALLDTYLFEQEVDGVTRVAAAVASPPEDFNEDEVALLKRIATTEYGVFRLRRGDDDFAFYIEDSLNRDRRFSLPIAGMIPSEAHVDDLLGLRLVHDEDNVAWVVGFPLIVPPKARQFFVNEPAVLELAGMMSPLEEGTTLSPVVMMRAIIAGRVVQAYAAETGQRLKLNRGKRSLARKSRKRR